MAGWTLISSGVVPVSTRTLLITGLDGDSDMFYRLTMQIYNDWGSAAWYSLEPNALRITAFNTLYFRVTPGGLSSGTFGALMYYLGYVNINGYGLIDVILGAKKGIPRISSSINHNNLPEMYLCTGTWNDVTTNITSLQIEGSNQNAIGAGTYWMLTKPS